MDAAFLNQRDTALLTFLYVSLWRRGVARVTTSVDPVDDVILFSLPREAIDQQLWDVYRCYVEGDEWACMKKDSMPESVQLYLGMSRLALSAIDNRWPDAVNYINENFQCEELPFKHQVLYSLLTDWTSSKNQHKDYVEKYNNFCSNLYFVSQVRYSTAFPFKDAIDRYRNQGYDALPMQIYYLGMEKGDELVWPFAGTADFAPHLLGTSYRFRGCTSSKLDYYLGFMYLDVGFGVDSIYSFMSRDGNEYAYRPEDDVEDESTKLIRNIVQGENALNIDCPEVEEPNLPVDSCTLDDADWNWTLIQNGLKGFIRPNEKVDYMLVNFAPEMNLRMDEDAFFPISAMECQGDMMRECWERLSERGRMSIYLERSQYDNAKDSFLREAIDCGELSLMVWCKDGIIVQLDKRHTAQESVKLILAHRPESASEEIIFDYELIKAYDYLLDPRIYYDAELAAAAPEGFECVALSDLCTPITYSDKTQVAGEIKTLSFEHGGKLCSNNPYQYELNAEYAKGDSRTHHSDKKELFAQLLDKIAGGGLLKSRIVDEDELLVHMSLKNILECYPYWISTRLGSFGVKVTPPYSCFHWALDRHKVDPHYLIFEMNKPYFRDQLQAINSSEWGYHPEQMMLSLHVYMPKSKTPLERQQELVLIEQTKYLKEVSQGIGVDLQDIYKGKVTYLAPKTKLRGGRYEILGSLGQGGFGLTYKAWDNVDEKEVAIKEFFSSQFQKRSAENHHDVLPMVEYADMMEKALHKFDNEVRIIQVLNAQQNIIPIYDVFDENKTSYYVMEYLPHGDLESYAKRGLTEREVIRIIREVGEALRAIHGKQILHLDVKPSNVMMVQPGAHIRLIDFGFSRQFVNSHMDRSMCISSFGYSAPELTHTQHGELKPATDIYSLGAVLKHLLSLESDLSYMLPSNEAPSHFHAPQHTCISKPTLEAIRKAMMDRVEDRPQTIDEFLNLLPNFK